jgi:predicted nuclease of predicted toxin-antitoxin system
MRFLLDQSTDARLIPYLRSLGHDATRIGKDHPSGLPDTQVLAIATAEGRILITDDRDFGDLVFQHRQPHAGVIYLRLGDDAGLPIKLAPVGHVLTNYADRLERFLTVSRYRVRVRES